MDIKKFLKDNKGCPLTVPAIKQLLVKFIELLSNKGVVKDEVSNIRELSKETLDELQVGDIVQKVTGNQKHAYMVTYKGEGTGEGICLTYCAAGYMETVSYDRDGTGWVYNSTDVFYLTEEEMAKLNSLLSKVHVNINEDNIEFLFENGVIFNSSLYIGDITSLKNNINDDEQLIPLENNAGKVFVVNETEDGLEAVSLPSGGTQLYKHEIEYEDGVSGTAGLFYIISASSTPLSDLALAGSNFNLTIGCDFISGSWELSNDEFYWPIQHIYYNSTTHLMTLEPDGSGDTVYNIQSISFSDIVTPL